MKYQIKRYQVKHSLLRKYIKFFWEINTDYMQLNHKLIPTRNINLRFNISETPHYVVIDEEERLLEDVFFLGLHEQFKNIFMKLNGKVHIMGVCFQAEGFFPFTKVPISEFKNNLLGAEEIGLNYASVISEKLKTAGDINLRLKILEDELLSMLDNDITSHENFIKLVHALKKNSNSIQLADFCDENNISIRNLERMFNKYVGVSAKTYLSINRFQNGINQLLCNDFNRLLDIAYSNGYFDQMHFIKEFKRFTGDTPKKFVTKNNSLLQIGRFT